MKKWMICILCVLLSLGLFPAGATSLDPQQPCSLTLSYQQGGNPYPGLTVDIYRVAEARADGSFHLTADYAPSGVDISHVTSQQEWRDIADTLSAHIAAGQFSPTCTATTSQDGVAAFPALDTGLYLVGQVTAGKEYQFERFMVYLPTPADGAFQYDVTAKPKPGPLPSYTEYQVLKLWKDSGSSKDRPESVTVDILRDGQVQESVILSNDNNWSYSWQVPDGSGTWTVSERDVPAGYRATVSVRETTFVITNTKRTPPEPEQPDTPSIPDLPSVPVGPGSSETPVDPDIPGSPNIPDQPETPVEPSPGVPKTGDAAPLELYIMAMCISGLLLMVLGLGGRRSRRHETKT